MSPWLLAAAAAWLLGEAPPPAVATTPTTCTYDTWTWSSTTRRAVDHRHVQKPYTQLTAEEKAPDWATTGCTACREDQRVVAVAGAPEVRVCHAYAARVEAALTRAIADGFHIETLVGYRVGRSGGPAVDGKRTRYGWHAYGEALDVNSAANGLYVGCARDARAPNRSLDLAGCRRTLGGDWDPSRRPATSLTNDGPLLRAFEHDLGWRWGGIRADGLKDLMHVSPDGY